MRRADESIYRQCFSLPRRHAVTPSGFDAIPTYLTCKVLLLLRGARTTSAVWHRLCPMVILIAEIVNGILQSSY